MKKLLIPIIIVVALGVGAGAMFFILGGFDSGDPKPTPVWEPATQDVQWPAGDKFTTNLKGELGKYIVVDIVLVAKATEEEPDTIDAEVASLTSLLDSKKAVIRDTMISVLRSFSVEDMADSGAQNKIKAAMISALNKKLEIDNITGVLFDNFIVG
jgi:flagellar basal body-associated protein FliL